MDFEGGDRSVHEKWEAAAHAGGGVEGNGSLGQDALSGLLPKLSETY